MKWFKKNWLILVLIVLVILIGRSKFTDFRGYKDQIEAKSDSIKLLKVQYDSLDDRETTVIELIDSYKIDLTSYQDSLSNARTQYINQNKRHAQEVADFNRMPTDSLYLEYIRWIDTISFE